MEHAIRTPFKLEKKTSLSILYSVSQHSRMLEEKRNMRVRDENTESYIPGEFDGFSDEDEAQLSHKKKIRKRLEEKLESRRLRHELEDYDEDYGWDDLDR